MASIDSLSLMGKDEGGADEVLVGFLGIEEAVRGCGLMWMGYSGDPGVSSVVFGEMRGVAWVGGGRQESDEGGSKSMLR